MIYAKEQILIFFLQFVQEKNIICNSYNIDYCAIIDRIDPREVLMLYAFLRMALMGKTIKMQKKCEKSI